MIGRTVLSRVKDAFIESHLRGIGGVKERPSRLYLPKNGPLGKPKAEFRGRAKLSTAGPSPFRRQVFVCTSFYKMRGKGYRDLHSHIRYIERPGAGEREVTPSLINAMSDAVPAHTMVKDWSDDRHYFRIILAPEDGAKLDMAVFTRAFMAEMEHNLKTRLIWFAGIHEKPDATHAVNRHVHIVMRGIAADGSDLVLNREFIRSEMKRTAEEIATRQLGQLSQREVERRREREMERERKNERHYDSGYRPSRAGSERPHRKVEREPGVGWEVER